MSFYQAVPVQVEAIRYQGELVRELPKWVQGHQGHTTYGYQGVGRSAVGELMIPVNGSVVTVKHGDYIVKTPVTDRAQSGDEKEPADEKFEVSVIKAADFEARFQAVAGPDA